VLRHQRLTDSQFRMLPPWLVTGTGRCDHISPVLRQLHWLTVRQRVVFKIATLVYPTRSCSATPQVTWPMTVRSSGTPVSDNRVLPTLDTGHLNTRCQWVAQQFWRQDLCCRRTTSLKQSAA